MSLSVWFGFLVAAILIAVTPGPGMAASVAAGMRHGYRAALTLILGLQTAFLIHLAIVAVGLGTLLATSETAFDLVKFCGAAYLVWLGVQKWRERTAAVESTLPQGGQRGLYLQGVLVNLTNPKAIVFIAALVPQFVDPAQPQTAQYLLIALTLCLVDIVTMSACALAAARLGRWLHDPQALRLQNRLFGGIFVIAGTALALSSRPH